MLKKIGVVAVKTQGIINQTVDYEVWCEGKVSSKHKTMTDARRVAEGKEPLGTMSCPKKETHEIYEVIRIKVNWKNNE